MRDEIDLPETFPTGDAQNLQSRRSLLRMSALGAAAVMTIRPGMAQGAASSALTCKIPLPLAADAGKRVKLNGDVVSPPPPPNTTTWAFPSQPLAGEDVKNAIKFNTTIPGTSSNQTDAYLAYINKKIKSGKPGFTCYASLQSPERF